MQCKNILVVEDDSSVRQIMQDVLEIEGYHVITAKDGKEGIERLRTLSPQPCLILLDLMMPETNGWKFLDFQRADPLLANIPVIICSAYYESAKTVRANAIVEKPVSLDTLLDTVHEFCA